ncbi:two-component sensor protein, partial [Vibrio xuii]
MRLPKISSLYGRIFAIFWFTMFLVLLAVLALPHLDPRKARDIPPEHFQRMLEAKKNIEQRYKNSTDLGRIIFELEGGNRSHRDGRPRYFLTDVEGNIL